MHWEGGFDEVSVSLPPLASCRCAERGGWREALLLLLLGYASQRLPAVLIGSGLRQSISKCPSLWEKQWEIRNPQLAGRGAADGPLSQRPPKGHCVHI